MSTLPLFMESREREDEQEKGKEKDTAPLLQLLKKTNASLPVATHWCEPGDLEYLNCSKLIKETEPI